MAVVTEEAGVHDQVIQQQQQVRISEDDMQRIAEMAARLVRQENPLQDGQGHPGTPAQQGISDAGQDESLNLRVDSDLEAGASLTLSNLLPKNDRVLLTPRESRRHTGSGRDPTGTGKACREDQGLVLCGPGGPVGRSCPQAGGISKSVRGQNHLGSASGPSEEKEETNWGHCYMVPGLCHPGGSASISRGHHKRGGGRLAGPYAVRHPVV
ncbi:PREDICTED: uncharacterized protein LOC109591036 [Amphimedon queenslandica]|uniref:Uncharacterized protein n=1 Tax=Amphimedon queenslandica TaxID=400682 RepID=A0A1X7SX12_AMPQE|nr:PREDICTED: uncharacterized protein LOC109591036 [Amphimedon queenslandica]|eukprot:XP_019862407.1 PREDICTED: uncharacterized protein LOC109591036 [Amphimedon queenslandica]